MCLQNCPCGTWVNCIRYSNKIWDDLHPETFNEQLHDWYDVHFRIAYELVNSMGNG